MLNKAIVPAAGLGTRLFLATKEQPKEKVYVLDHYNFVPAGSGGLIGVSKLLTRMIIACERSYGSFQVATGKKNDPVCGPSRLQKGLCT